MNLAKWKLSDISLYIWSKNLQIIGVRLRNSPTLIWYLDELRLLSPNFTFPKTNLTFKRPHSRRWRH